ncbi:(d)CMP kinase [Nisaea acidiphila]|uniref:Cytidylate kinase n=1 Tax=Nisaea acidiphila TaxID=1862145 RepID=A0A9J7B270_9PROT|nr:(d)CMP kinase [Nisaea acidiphila]UUX51765.1 (d)CMP kinase [Nisaea acidiphila]
MIIAIDGPAAAGKGTLARRLADELGCAYLDTGSLYRAVAVMVLRAGADPEDAVAAAEAARNLDRSILGSAELRTGEAGAAASKVAAIPEVRAALTDFQRGFATTPPDGATGAILDGRDIGTVICPDADRKLFVTASVEARAERRFKELQERGEAAIYARVLQDMRERDARDAGRSDAPMVQADDAVLIDTSSMTPDEAFAVALEVIKGTD